MGSDPTAQPDADPAARPRFGRELWTRVASALILVPVAIGAAYLGGWPFALFWMVAGLGVLWEWGRLLSARAAWSLVAVGAAALAAACLAVLSARPRDAALVLGAALAGAGLVARGWWGPAGILYAGSLVVAPILLRSDPGFGLVALLLLFAVVWATDIGAYFGGRLLGGPRLWPRVSPNKTWSGAVVGAGVGVAGALAVARTAGLENLSWIAVLALALSAASQLGDLLESAIKRRFSVKDAGRLIPGHGGLMDRLDGFIAAALLAALIGVARGGLEAPSRGLLIW
ncbi:MAG: phosphatidate cytidylyltransferase [Variibacter sp.]|nr:phosphatidate cytidylyltransferase [Variibacter sp.]